MTDQAKAKPTRELDLEHPSVARVYDSFLGGSSNYAVDRAFAAETLKVAPAFKKLARINREYLARVVRRCLQRDDAQDAASWSPVRQFLDIGSGIPTVGNVHQVADEIDPTSTCVYVDYEIVAKAHSEILLSKEGDPARHAFLHDRLENPDQVWRKAVDTGVLDPEKPVVLTLVAILHFMPNEEELHAALARYRDLLPSGSVLALSHVTKDGIPDDVVEEMEQAIGLYNTSTDSRTCFRTPQQIDALLGDWQRLDPRTGQPAEAGHDALPAGLDWLPNCVPGLGSSPATKSYAATPSRACVLGGMARKP